MNRNVSRSLAAAFVLSLALFSSACAVPLAPGYRIVKESRDVQFVPGQPAELKVGARYTLQNIGTADLAFVDAIFPEERAFGRANLRVEVNGHEASPANLPAGVQTSEPDALRIPLDPAWVAQPDAATFNRIHVSFTRKS